MTVEELVKVLRVAAEANRYDVPLSMLLMLAASKLEELNHVQ